MVSGKKKRDKCDRSKRKEDAYRMRIAGRERKRKRTRMNSWGGSNHTSSSQRQR